MIMSELRHDKLEEQPEDIGTRLRKAREAAGLTHAEIANRLRLTIQTIVHLEENNYSQLPGPTFVRGYLRSYAQLVDIKLEPVELAAKADNLLTNSISLAPLPLYKRQVSTKDGLMRWITYFIIGIIFILVLIAWNNQTTSDDVAIDLDNSVHEQNTILQPVGYDAKVPLRGLPSNPLLCSISFTFCTLVPSEVSLVD